jgi:hypothetical protein
MPIAVPVARWTDVVLEPLTSHGRNHLSEHVVSEVRTDGLGAGDETHAPIPLQQSSNEPGSVRAGLVGAVDPPKKQRVGQTGAT